MATTQDFLRESLPAASARWTRPVQFHLTLRFLGNVRTASADDLIQALRNACGSIPPVQLRAKGVGFFPKTRTPRVVWIGVQDSNGELLRLHRAIEQASLAFSKEKPEERFSGHITLGRLKDLPPQQARLLTSAAERFSGSLFGEWTAREIQLMRSRVSSRGAEHERLAAVPLAENLSLDRA